MRPKKKIYLTRCAMRKGLGMKKKKAEMQRVTSYIEKRWFHKSRIVCVTHIMTCRIKAEILKMN